MQNVSTKRREKINSDEEERIRLGYEIKAGFRFAVIDGRPACRTSIISKEDVELARTWPAQGPPVLWSVDVGEGYASAAILDGMVYVLDYDREKQADVVRCLSLDDGKDISRHSYPVKVNRNHGMSRTVPAS